MGKGGACGCWFCCGIAAFTFLSAHARLLRGDCDRIGCLERGASGGRETLHSLAVPESFASSHPARAVNLGFFLGMSQRSQQSIEPGFVKEQSEHCQSNFIVIYFLSTTRSSRPSRARPRRLGGGRRAGRSGRAPQGPHQGRRAVLVKLGFLLSKGQLNVAKLEPTKRRDLHFAKSPAFHPVLPTTPPW